MANPKASTIAYAEHLAKDNLWPQKIIKRLLLLPIVLQVYAPSCPLHALFPLPFLGSKLVIFRTNYCEAHYILNHLALAFTT